MEFRAIETIVREWAWSVRAFACRYTSTIYVGVFPEGHIATFESQLNGADMPAMDLLEWLETDSNGRRIGVVWAHALSDALIQLEARASELVKSEQAQNFLLETWRDIERASDIREVKLPPSL